ncbi:N-acetylmuramoyl-L-alanine amidase [Apibacter muscae]|uniref:N-acetylmuramoyl-L-alanine amidase n=1 Tax=Apibacter muscae TaxID=2509004 RepID=UPI0011ABD8F2|nr:N-acetylmuramoyl-L-alanine amidase [Apibacter muscae]TWP31817.1 N-acetylmuramoyl-L-alanine amidase [Apibacter muscae]
MSVEKLYPETGHNLPGKGVKEDPGAVANGYKENELTILFMDTVLEEFRKLGGDFQRDDDQVSLASNIATIRKTIKHSDLIYSVHFNAATSKATGTETIVSNYAGVTSQEIAKEISEVTSRVLGIANRGVKKEKDTPRRKLAILNLKGTAVLHEVCFITNPNDMEKFFKNYKTLAKEIAVILKYYDDLLNK